MKKSMTVCAAAAMLAGCEMIKLPQVEPARVEPEQPRFIVAVQKDCHPNRGDKFIHDGSAIEVFQVVRSEGFVLAQKGVDYTKVDSVLNRGLVIRVDSTDDYVKDELLRPGVYEYVGTYTYETEKNGSNTVRRFKRVSDK